MSKISDRRKERRCSGAARLLVILTFLFASISPLMAHEVETIETEQSLRLGGGSAFNHFAQSVAVAGDVLAVGAPYDDSIWSDSGSVYLYVRENDTWRLKKRIQPKSPRQNGYFGAAVALEGGSLVVGEPGSEWDQRGYVHIFSKNYGGSGAWGVVRSISRPDDCHLRVQDGFGAAVAVDGANLLVGAPTACKSRDDWIDTTGAAYVYSQYGAVFMKKIIAHNGVEGDQFGSSVSLCGSFAFVGAPDADGGQLREDVGAVYLYNGSSNWGLHKFLSPTETLADDHFGTSLSCSASYAAVGAPATSSSYGDDDRKGTVYLYGRNQGGTGNWGLAGKFAEEDYYNEDSGRNNHFGQSVSLAGTSLVVGFGESNKSGAEKEPMAQVFSLQDTGWKPLKTLTLTVDSECSTSVLDLGFSVATDGETCAIGDMEDESSADICISGGSAARIYRKRTRDVKPLTFLKLLL